MSVTAAAIRLQCCRFSASERRGARRLLQTLPASGNRATLAAAAAAADSATTWTQIIATSTGSPAIARDFQTSYKARTMLITAPSIG